mgnify:CR=1 FL=1
MFIIRFILFFVKPEGVAGPRQFTVGIKRTDSTNFVLLIKLFELGIPFKGRQAFSKSNLVLEPHLFNGLGAYSTLNSIKIFTIGSASFVFKSNHLLWCKANLIFFDFNKLLLESNKIYHLSAVQAVCSEPCHCISTYQTPRHWLLLILALNTWLTCPSALHATSPLALLNLAWAALKLFRR